jgi:hypothetical protein
MARREAWWIWAMLSAVYAALIYFQVQRPLWYDELLTHYIAQASTAGKMLELVTRFDYTPPATFFLTRWSISLFGNGLVGTRLPSILEFYAASAALFFYARRKANAPAAACAVLLLWASPILYYATEARPYALMLASFSSLLLLREFAITQEHRTLALWSMGLANTCLLTSHAFAAFSLLPFFAAEAARSYSRRRPDYGQWLALTLPLAAMAGYIPEARHYIQVLYPPIIQGSVRNAVHFFIGSLSGMAPGLFVFLLAALMAPRFSGGRETRGGTIRRDDLILLAGLIANPFLLNLLLKWQHVAYWDRYCITTAVALCIALTIYLARRLVLSRIALCAAAIVLLIPITAEQIVRPLLHARRYNAEQILRQQPELPLVAVSALTFLEMDHDYGSALGSRLFYLQNREAAVKYAHETMFEDLEPPALLKRYLPIRGSVEQYDAFVQHHQTFLMLASPDYTEDWLLRKLLDDGAQLLFTSAYNVPYRNSILYRVILPGLRIKH